MGDVKNISNTEAIQKLQELAKDETCLFGTYIGDHALRTRPMATSQIDYLGNFWFMSNKSSNKNNEIGQVSKVPGGTWPCGNCIRQKQDS